MSVTSEIWQDLFLPLLSEDFFADNDAAEEAEEEEKECHRGGGDRQQLACLRIQVEAEGKDSREYCIECLPSTSVQLVGLQMWRGAFLLADFILHNPELFRKKTVLELAAGTGFTSIVAGNVADRLICTDVDRGSILDNIRRNFELNRNLICSPYQIEEVDFFRGVTQLQSKDWLHQLDVILVADVVYDPQVTKHFFSTLESLLRTSNRHPINVYIAVEKRLHLDASGHIVSPNFSLFLELLRDFEQRWALYGRLSSLDCDFQRRILCYDRVKELFLWHFMLIKSPSVSI